MADPILAVSRLGIPTAAYNGGSAPISIPVSAQLLWVGRQNALDYVYYQHTVDDDTLADKFLTVVGLAEGVTNSPAQLPRPLGTLLNIAIGGAVQVAWEIFPHT